MLFNSYIFLFLFLPAALAGYYVLNYLKQFRLADVFLIGMSLWFYGYFNPSYVAIICGSIAANFVLSKAMERAGERQVLRICFKKLLLAAGICGNLAVIFYFKYFNFFLENVNAVFGRSFELRNIVLPLGISFFTFQQVSYLVDSFSNGRVMTEGIKTVILGKPNVGKSSLMNVLLGEERAIVTNIAGTTRDTLEERLSLGGITLNVVDTAGIRDTQDVVEQIGVDRAKQAALDADLIIYVVDGSGDLDENDEEIMAFIRDKKALVLLNKTDLEMKVSFGELEKKSGKKVIPVSAKEERGLDELEEEIKKNFYGGELRFNDEVIITNVRQKTALEAGLCSIRMVKQSIEEGLPEDFFSIDLMDAYKRLGTVIGEAVEDDLVNEIFHRFCMGK